MCVYGTYEQYNSSWSLRTVENGPCIYLVLWSRYMFHIIYH